MRLQLYRWGELKETEADSSSNDSENVDGEFGTNYLHTESTRLCIYKCITINKLGIRFPNIRVTLHLNLTLMITNCFCKQSFYKLRHISNELQSHMKQLNTVVLLSAERQIFWDIDMSYIIDRFSQLKAFRKDVERVETLAGEQNVLSHMLYSFDFLSNWRLWRIL